MKWPSSKPEKVCKHHIRLLLKSENTSTVPVNSLNEDEDLLPGPVGSRLAVHDSIPKQLLQTLHI